MSTALNNTAPYLALTRGIATTGIFPTREGSGEPFTLGGIRTIASNFAPGSSLLAQGQILPISQNTALFSLYGTQYGGNGTTNFALPNLGGNISVNQGQGPGLSLVTVGEVLGSSTTSLLQSELAPSSGGTSLPTNNLQPELTTTYAIVVEGIFPSQGGGSGFINIMGAIVEFGGNFAPGSTLPADGRLLPIAQYDALFAILGTTYGGDGQTTFALPDLRGRTIIGTGTLNGQTYTLGQTGGSETFSLTGANMPTLAGGAGGAVDNHSPYLALNYLVALAGIFPSNGGGGGWDNETPFLGEVVAFAGNFAPSGFALARGQLLPINQNQALFSLLGINFGGNGTTNFALPNLQGRSVIGTNGQNPIGSTGGVETITVTLDNIPALNIAGTPAADFFYGGNDPDTINGSTGNDTLRGRGGNDTINGGDGDDTMFGHDGNNFLNGGNNNDTAYGHTGVDTIHGDAGNDSLYGYDNNDVIFGDAGNDNLYGGNNDDTLNGGTEDDQLVGQSGNDTLNGGTGSNTMIGGIGDDIYIVDVTTDSLVENVGEGTDLVQASISGVTLGANIENLTYTGVGNFVGIGNALDNVITGAGLKDDLVGLDGNDRLIGGAGVANEMIGGLGNDTYVVGHVGDTTHELAGQGTDTVETSLALYTLNANVENLTYTGAVSFTGRGNTESNVIIGGAQGDFLFGLAGSDTLTGGGGSDRFSFNAGDTGVDTITDFVSGTDKIGIDGGGFSHTATIAFAQGASPAPTNTNSTFLYNSTTGIVSYDPDGTGAALAIQLANIGAGKVLAAGDFVIF